MPSYYPGTGKGEMGLLRTGQMTSWGREHGYAQGVGQRDFNVNMGDGGASMVGMLQLVKLDFDVQASVAPEKPKSFWQRLFG